MRLSDTDIEYIDRGITLLLLLMIYIKSPVIYRTMCKVTDKQYISQS